MKIKLHKSFIKSFDKRIRNNINIRKKFNERVNLFKKDPFNSLLKDHELKGDMVGFRSFSVTGDIRVIYSIHNDIVVFVDIGTHSQVYS